MATQIRTQHDLAQLLKVSRVTVQRALSDHPYVNDGLRAEIQAAAKKYGYRPYANAQSLRTGQTHAIGVLLFNVRSVNAVVGPVFFEYLAGITDRLVEQEYKTIVVRDWQLAGEDVPHTPILFRERAMDGLICTHPTTPLLTQFIEKLNVPVIWLDSGHHEPGKTISRDESGAVRLAMQTLLNLGHRRIAYLGKGVDGPMGESRKMYPAHHSTTERKAAYDSIMAEHNLTPINQPVVSFESSIEPLKQMLQQPNRPTACLCYSVYEAFWVQSACIELGLRVPRDLSILALDDNASIIEMWPDLGRITFDRYAMGRLAAEMMLTTLDGQCADPPSVNFQQHHLLGRTFAPPSM